MHNDFREGTDITEEIIRLLEEGKAVYIPKGTFICGEIQVPNDAHIEGNKNSILKLKDGANYLFKAGADVSATVKGFTICGEHVDRPTSVGSSMGIVLGDDCGNIGDITIQDMTFRGFSKAAIWASNTGYNPNNVYTAVAMIRGCRFFRNAIGLWASPRAEYMNVSSCMFGDNLEGARVCGGNNMFTGCQFNRNNAGMVIHGTRINHEGCGKMAHANDTHFSLVGCQFNHCGRGSGNYAIRILGASVGIMVTGSQFWDGIVEIVNSVGIVFSASEFGLWQFETKEQSPVQVQFSSCYFHGVDEIKERATQVACMYLPV